MTTGRIVALQAMLPFVTRRSPPVVLPKRLSEEKGAKDGVVMGGEIEVFGAEVDQLRVGQMIGTGGVLFTILKQVAFILIGEVAREIGFGTSWQYSNTVPGVELKGRIVALQEIVPFVTRSNPPVVLPERLSEEKGIMERAVMGGEIVVFGAEVDQLRVGHWIWVGAPLFTILKQVAFTCTGVAAREIGFGAREQYSVMLGGLPPTLPFRMTTLANVALQESGEPAQPLPMVLPDRMKLNVPLNGGLPCVRLTWIVRICPGGITLFGLGIKVTAMEFGGLLGCWDTPVMFAERMVEMEFVTDRFRMTYWPVVRLNGPNNPPAIEMKQEGFSNRTDREALPDDEGNVEIAGTRKRNILSWGELPAGSLSKSEWITPVHLSRRTEPVAVRVEPGSGFDARLTCVWEDERPYSVPLIITLPRQTTEVLLSDEGMQSPN